MLYFRLSNNLPVISCKHYIDVSVERVLLSTAILFVVMPCHGMLNSFPLNVEDLYVVLVKGAFLTVQSK